MKLFIKMITVGLIASTVLNADYYSNNSYGKSEGYVKYRVVSSTPVTKSVTKRVQTGDEIRERVIKKAVPCGSGKDTNIIGLDTIIGAGIGLAVGNKIGKGHGREAARVLGSLGGGYIANQMRNDYGNCYEERVVYDRVPRYENITEELITGYNNCVEVDGERLCKESKTKKKFLRIKKTYSIY